MIADLCGKVIGSAPLSFLCGLSMRSLLGYTQPSCWKASHSGQFEGRQGSPQQLKFLLGHSSIQTTERYLGSEQEIAIAVNDNLGL